MQSRSDLRLPGKRGVKGARCGTRKGGAGGLYPLASRPLIRSASQGAFQRAFSRNASRRAAKAA